MSIVSHFKKKNLLPKTLKHCVTKNRSFLNFYAQNQSILNKWNELIGDLF